MYLPQSFEENRIEVLHALMRANPLAALVTGGLELAADHVPMLLQPTSGPLGKLCGHVARANPLWRTHDPAREALTIFQGAQAYISPTLYPSKLNSGEVVPTWDYAVVHAYGSLRFVHDPPWLLKLVSDLTLVHEAGRDKPWSVTDAPTPYVAKMLHAIVGFEFSIMRLAGKWKVSQNKSGADREGVMRGLAAATDPQAREIADMLRQRTPGGGKQQP